MLVKALFYKNINDYPYKVIQGNSNGNPFLSY